MNYFKLANDDHLSITFWADHSQLKARLNSAYIEFREKHGVSQVLLYVRHRDHGWRQVCDPDNTYIIIDSPLTLDQGVLALAVTHTLVQADRIPTPEQQRKNMEKHLQTERFLDAEIKRNTFHIVKDHDDTP
jgi:hypothetical protein